ncbi:MAG: CYTH domain-containing protein [Muribaculaceae bacterium]|nr:CYTH domain-containing protein [Muribaculaceae bacterium]
MEIERKFIVTSDAYRRMASASHHIAQGYLSRDPDRTVRVRVRDSEGFLTVKGRTRGFSREEFEYAVGDADARQMLALCLPVVVEKTRWIVDYAGLRWEVDEFHGSLQGLVVAEVELESEDQPVELPPFVGREVSDDPAYFNSSLSIHGMPADAPIIN